MKRRIFRAALLLCFYAIVGGWFGALSAQAREEIPANNDVALQIRVERGGRLWALTDIPALQYGDLLHVQLTNATALHPEFPHVIRQRLNSMPSDHGLMIVAAFVQASDRAGLGNEAFEAPFLSQDSKELLFRVKRDDVTPFLLMVPAIYDGKRRGEWFELRNDIRKKPELKPLRDYLLRDFEAASVGGEVGVAFREGDDPDNSLKVAEFLLPRIVVANQARAQPEFQKLTRSQQTDKLYGALGVDLPDKPGSYEYINSFLDAFVPSDPAQAVKVPDGAILGALLQQGFTFLPQWYSAPLRGLELIGKLGVLLSGLNKRPKPDEKYFVSVRWTPKTVAAGTANATPAFTNAFSMDPVERLEEKSADGRQRKNILIACLGRTGFKKAVVKPTLTVANAGVVYLSNINPARSLSLDGGSPLSPDQLSRFASGLTLQLLDGTAPIPLLYDAKTGAFLLNSPQPLPTTPRNAVIRGDWGRIGKAADLTQPFQVCGVERGAWTMENGSALILGGAATIRLKTDQPLRPLQVIFRYQGGAAITAAEIADVPNAPGVFAVRFDLSNQRAGEGRLEVYRPPAGDAPALVETYQEGSSGEQKVKIYDPVRVLTPADTEYYAYDSRLRLRTSAFPESAFPTKITLGATTFDRGATLEDGWVAFDTKTPGTTVGNQNATFALKDGRTSTGEVRVRPRRPAFAVMERLREMPPQPFPWELPERVATQYSALEIRLTAAEGYHFPATAQLKFGPVTITPDIIPTGAQGADSITFTLDPRSYPNLRGQLIGRLFETREGNEVVSSVDIPLAYTLAQVPDLPVSLRYANGKYRLIGQNVNLIERAGASGALNPVTAVGTGATAYIEFPAAPGIPLYFQPRMLGTPLKWAGPITPAAPVRPAVDYNPAENAATVRFDRAAGATSYRVYRLTRPDEPLTPQNRVTILPATDAANYSVRDDSALQPGIPYQYRVVAIHQREGYGEPLFPEADFSAFSDFSEPILTRPAAVQTVAVERGADGVVRVRFARAAGATVYRIHRGETPDFAPSMENRAGADLPAAPADSPTWTETSPLTPGHTYYYKVVAVATREGLREQVAPPSPASNGVAIP